MPSADFHHSPGLTQSALREAALCANQNSVRRLRDEHTLDRVTEFFGVTILDRSDPSANNQ